MRCWFCNVSLTGGIPFVYNWWITRLGKPRLVPACHHGHDCAARERMS
jgi:hypothetical protein